MTKKLVEVNMHTTTCDIFLPYSFCWLIEVLKTSITNPAGHSNERCVSEVLVSKHSELQKHNVNCVNSYIMKRVFTKRKDSIVDSNNLHNVQLFNWSFLYNLE